MYEHISRYVVGTTRPDNGVSGHRRNVVPTVSSGRERWKSIPATVTLVDNVDEETKLPRLNQQSSH